MQTGPALDVAVAQALGLTVLTPEQTEYALLSPDSEHYAERIHDRLCVLMPHEQFGLMRYYLDSPGFWGQRRWHPSTSIAATWEAIKEMEQRGYWCQMRTPYAGPGGSDGYWAGFAPHGVTGCNGQPARWASAPTLEEAVCHAIIATLGAAHGRAGAEAC